MRKFVCAECGWVYDESEGMPQKNILPGTKWEDVPDNFICPGCSASKLFFILAEET